MNRREMLVSIASGLAAVNIGHLTKVYGENQSRKSRLGIAAFSYNIRIRAERTQRTKEGLSDPLNFLEHCNNVGAGGIQTNIGIKDKNYTRRLRQKAEAYDMFVEGSISLPKFSL